MGYFGLGRKFKKRRGQKMPENTGKEIAPLSEFEVLEQVDDQAIVQMMTGQAIKDYVYSFKQGGKVVEGLTLAGINEAANRRGGIEVDTIEHEERDKSWIAVVKAVDTITGSSRYGACEQKREKQKEKTKKTQKKNKKEKTNKEK